MKKALSPVSPARVIAAPASASRTRPRRSSPRHLFQSLAGLLTSRETLPTSRSGLEAARDHDGAFLIDFKVEQEDTVYPMVAAGASLHDMIRRPSPIVETATDE